MSIVTTAVRFQLSVQALKAVRNPLENPPWNKYCTQKLAPFTSQDIEAARRDPELEILGAESNEVWGDRDKPNNEYCNRRRHLLRIAYLVVHKDEKPIEMMSVKKLTVDDGWHRLAAAIHRRDETIEAVKAAKTK